MIDSTKNKGGRAPGAFAAVTILLILLTAGCGQGGPLYLPDDGASADTKEESATADSPEKDEDDAENSGT